MRVLALFAVCLLWYQPSLAQERRELGVVDMTEVPSIQDPQLSPNGTRILFVIDGADWTANRGVGHIYRIHTDGTGQVQLTCGERGETSPRWSPDGRRVAFLARRGDDTRTQPPVA